MFEAGVKEYRETYWTPGYVPRSTDVLAAFRLTPQPEAPPERAAARPGPRLTSLPRAEGQFSRALRAPPRRAPALAGRRALHLAAAHALAQPLRARTGRRE